MKSFFIVSYGGKPQHLHSFYQQLKKLNPCHSIAEEELERICGAIHGLLRAHERREATLTRLESDKELFTQGKVSEMRAKFNERRNSKGQGQERSDGVTDDDDDIVC